MSQDGRVRLSIVPDRTCRRRVVDPELLAEFNRGVARARAAVDETDCEVTVWDVAASAHGLGRTKKPCGKPLAPDARLCEKHEADRLRLAADRG